MKRTDDHSIFFDLGSDWDFSNIDSVFNYGERSEPENFDYKLEPQGALIAHLSTMSTSVNKLD